MLQETRLFFKIMNSRLSVIILCLCLSSLLILSLASCSVSQTSLVKELYADVYQKEPNPIEMDYWIGLLKSGTTKTQLKNYIKEYPGTQKIVIQGYAEVLYRTPTVKEYNNWITLLLEQRVSPKVFKAHLINTQENLNNLTREYIYNYRLTLFSILYHDFGLYPDRKTIIHLDSQLRRQRHVTLNDIISTLNTSIETKNLVNHAFQSAIGREAKPLEKILYTLMINRDNLTPQDIIDDLNNPTYNLLNPQDYHVFINHRFDHLKSNSRHDKLLHRIYHRNNQQQ